MIAAVLRGTVGQLSAGTVAGDPPGLYWLQFKRPHLMRFSPATRLDTRQTEWVAYRNDGTNFNLLTPPMGHLATSWSAHFAETFERDVVPVTFE